MNDSLLTYLQELKERGLTPEREAQLRSELQGNLSHTLRTDHAIPEHDELYGRSDFCCLQDRSEPQASYTSRIGSLEELLERDRLREQDGFPRKIRVGRLIKPGRGDKTKFVVVPTTVEEKFIHDRIRPPGEEGASGGSGAGEEGEVIGEQPIRPEGDQGGGGAGHGGGESHELESSAYDLGKILTEKFELPNLKEKGKKSALARYTYELTDKNRGFGQILDKKATLKRILETNIALGNAPDLYDIDTTRFLIAPRDKVYRILSRELDYESQAMIFFLRDYSGSMAGKATELVASQHVLIYSWLIYQYERQVESRFILHDDQAREVPDFYTYYNLQVAGGTKVAAGYRLVNEIVAKENLARDYNIYVFHGTDGDDWDTDGSEALPELKQILTYASRVGITIAGHTYNSGQTEVQKYLNASGLLSEKPDLIRLDVMDEDADETRLIEGIRKLIS
ncbi:DUF444 family protein [Geobacter sp. OR-1]|uniref:DUF444 family protein n=1 Tax=Geobacter sp. OR-1 TaxID=1266765 RepID=UPI0005A821FE